MSALLLGIPYLKIGHIGPIQGFGLIVMIGVLIGASVLGRYGKLKGMKAEHIQGLETWITATGFIGAHLFYVFAYEPQRLMREPWWILKVWDGIASYGGFIGGAIGFAYFVRSRKLPPRLTADVALVGLLLAFSIGRLGCTLVSDHVGTALANPDAWYGFLAMDYPRSAARDNGNIADLYRHAEAGVQMIRAWNLGLIELLYLIPVNALVLFLAFRRKHAPGFLAVLIGVLYAPIRFLLEFPRLENSDPRYAGLTFAQWGSIVFFGAALALAIRLRQPPADAKRR